jgi:uncharacterized membrane protein
MVHNNALFIAVYDDVSMALADLDAFRDLHRKEIIGHYDAAVVENKDGKPHIAKRVDRPLVRIIPELLGSGALPSIELKEAARKLTSGHAGLIVIGAATLEKAFDQAVSRAATTVKRTMDAATDQLTYELIEGFQG